MGIKVYYSGISASPEIRSYQQRAQFILDSLRLDYESIDITDTNHLDIKEMIKEKCKHRNEQPPKTPQFFNDDVYCGDWFDFEIASDEDRVLEWLGLEGNRYDDLPETELEKVNQKEIEGKENKDNTNENASIKTKIEDGIITTETVTKEESIIFSKQNAKTAPISVRLDDSGKEIIELKDENAVLIEEETCVLENENSFQVTKGEEEVVTRVIENKKSDESVENGDVFENGTDQDEKMKSDDEENAEEKNESDEEKNDEFNDDEKIKSDDEKIKSDDEMIKSDDEVIKADDEDRSMDKE